MGGLIAHGALADGGGSRGCRAPMTAAAPVLLLLLLLLGAPSIEARLVKDVTARHGGPYTAFRGTPIIVVVVIAIGIAIRIVTAAANANATEE